jgi:hypothetical protein
MPGLPSFGQADFSGGMVRAVARHRIPQTAVWDVQNGLLDDDGNLYQRAATTHATSSQLGTSVQAVWEAQFSVGRRTIVVGSTGLAVVDAAGTGFTLLVPGAAVAGGGLLSQAGEVAVFPLQYIGDQIIAYAGARKPSTVAYITGTLAVTKGSKTVTGTGTAWLANVEAGAIVHPLPLTGPQYGAVVASVDSDTQITLTEPYIGQTYSGAYLISAAMAITTGTAAAVVSNRLCVAEGRRVKMSKTVDPDTGQSRIWEFADDDYHEFSSDVVALAALRDKLFVFTRSGIHVVTGVAYEIVDAFGNAQHRVERVSGDVILRSAGGIATWRDSLVIAAVDGIYGMDSLGTLDLLSRSITPLWQAHMQAGHAVGQVLAFRDHAFVPVGGEVLVCRLDRRTKTPVGDSAPWTRLVGAEAGAVQALALRDPFGSPRLLAGTSTSGYLVDLTGIFTSSTVATTAVDANAAGYSMTIETRSFEPDAGNVATVRDCVVEYVLGAGTVAMSVSRDDGVTYSALGTQPAANLSTGKPRAVAVTAAARRVSFKLVFSGSQGARLRKLTFRFRPRGRWR